MLQNSKRQQLSVRRIFPVLANKINAQTNLQTTMCAVAVFMCGIFTTRLMENNVFFSLSWIQLIYIIDIWVIGAIPELQEKRFSYHKGKINSKENVSSNVRSCVIRFNYPNFWTLLEIMKRVCVCVRCVSYSDYLLLLSGSNLFMLLVHITTVCWLLFKNCTVSAVLGIINQKRPNTTSWH